MNEYSVPCTAKEFENAMLQTENAKIIPVAMSLDRAMKALTETEFVMGKILQYTTGSTPTDPANIEIHSLQDQAKLIAEKTDHVLNMANAIYQEIFGEEGVRNG